MNLCIYLNGWENGSWQGKWDGERILERKKKKPVLAAVVKMRIEAGEWMERILLWIHWIRGNQILGEEKGWVRVNNVTETWKKQLGRKRKKNNVTIESKGRKKGKKWENRWTFIFQTRGNGSYSGVGKS